METIYKVKSRSITINSLTEKIRIWFFGDIHRFTRSCDEDRWRWFLQSAKATHTPLTFYAGMGDYIDFASSKEQKILKQSGLHGNTMEDIDDSVEKKYRVLAQELSFMKPNILGLIDGNHNWVFQDGRTGTEHLADRLGTEYLGWLCHYSVNIDLITGKTSRRSLNRIHIVMCHGRAGGKTAGNTINQVSDLKNIFPVADLYVMGHDHQRGAWPIDILVPAQDHGRGPHLKQKRQFLCRGGSFKKGYNPDTSGYEVGRLLRPADLGALEMEIGFHRDQKDGRDNVITDIKAHI